MTNAHSHTHFFVYFCWSILMSWRKCVTTSAHWALKVFLPWLITNNQAHTAVNFPESSWNIRGDNIPLEALTLSCHTTIQAPLFLTLLTGALGEYDQAAYFTQITLTKVTGRYSRLCSCVVILNRWSIYYIAMSEASTCVRSRETFLRLWVRSRA